jgi:plasmid stability protein
MATLVIHDIPDDLLKKLEHSARENGRAVEREAVVWLSQIQVPSTLDRPTTEEMIRSFRELRNRYPDSYVTEEDVTRGKREGRLGDEIVESDQEPDPWLKRARKLRESMPDVYIEDEEELNRFKREGRL